MGLNMLLFLGLGVNALEIGHGRMVMVMNGILQWGIVLTKVHVEDVEDQIFKAIAIQELV